MHTNEEKTQKNEKKFFFLSPKTNFFLIEFKLSEFIHPFSLDVWNATSRSFSRPEVNITKYFTIVALTILRLKKKIEESYKHYNIIAIYCRLFDPCIPNNLTQETVIIIIAASWISKWLLIKPLAGTQCFN